MLPWHPFIFFAAISGCQSSSTTFFGRRLDSFTGSTQHLDAYRRNAAVGQSRSPGRHTRPDFAPKVQMPGCQRVPLWAGMNANGGADAGHKRRLENRLMVRRREQSRPAWPGSSKNFRVSVKVTINIAARLRASRQYQGPDLTGRRGSFTRSSLLCFVIGL